MTDVVAKYESGFFVPSYYGVRFSVAKRGGAFPIKGGKVLSEIDSSFIVKTLKDAEQEADRRNSAFGMQVGRHLLI